MPANKVIKRDGRFVDFDESKIYNAIEKAMIETGEDIDLSEIVDDVYNEIVDSFSDLNFYPTVENIQDTVEEALKSNAPKVFEHYYEFRRRRTRDRIKNTELIKKVRSISRVTERENANVGNNFSAKLLQIASAANKVSNLLDIPEDIAKAHESGDVHIHDLDSYNLTINCLTIDMAEVLKNGFNTGYGTINPPKRIESAAALACIVIQSCQNDMFGGQSVYDFDNDMAEYVELTRKEIKNNLREFGVNPNSEEFADKVGEKVREKVSQAMQIVVYNLNSMHSRAGSQVPFSSINLGIPRCDDAALVCEEFLKAFNKGLGKGEIPIFPNVIFKVKAGVNRGDSDPYKYLFDLASRVAANRMNPTFLNCDASFNDENSTTMGCRTRIANNVNGESGARKRGNIAPISINLPRLAIRAKGDYKEFLRLLKEKLYLCERQLLHRYNTLKKLKGSDIPFIGGQNVVMGADEVGEDDSIEPILKHGTYGIGFIGIAEVLEFLFGKHHGESVDSMNKALEIVKTMRSFCDNATKKNQLNFTCYATPAEGLSDRFTILDRHMFGLIEGVTDKGFYTNSYHIPVDFNIGIAEKMKLESPFHAICNAGHISYAELDGSPTDDPMVIQRIVKNTFENTDAGYIGINFGEVYCKDDGKNHIKGNKCPECFGTNLQKVDRVTGYLSLQNRFAPGKKKELDKRVKHE